MVKLSEDSKVIRKIWDESKEEEVEVEITARDALLFDYLKQIIARLRRNG